MTRKELIEETVKYYSEDTSRRSKLRNGTCVYSTKGGKHCAVGRCLKNKYQTTSFKCNVGYGVVGLHDEYYGIDNILKEKYRGHSTSFWRDLQFLHDCDDFCDFAVIFSGLTLLPGSPRTS